MSVTNRNISQLRSHVIIWFQFGCPCPSAGKQPEFVVNQVFTTNFFYIYTYTVESYSALTSMKKAHLF